MKKEELFLKELESDQPVLVDFFATWCGPCMAMNPILEVVEKNISGKGKIVKFDVDDNPKFAAEMGVMGVPTFMIFKNVETFLFARDLGVGIFKLSNPFLSFIIKNIIIINKGI